MSRMSEMPRCIADLKAAATALLSAAETLTALCPNDEPAADKPSPKPITKEEVRAELASKTAAGYGVQVRALLKKYGAAQLSAVKPEDYPKLLLDARAIVNEGGALAPTKPEDSRRLPQGCTQRREVAMGETEVDADG